MKEFIKNNKTFIIFISIISVVYFSSLFIHHDIWWDSAVFLGMGKYLWSLGNVGLWEASRPIIWPLLLGFFWKLNLNPIIFGQITAILFSIGTIALTYLIAVNIFNKKTALISSLFLSLFPTYFLFANILHTEIPSAFFTLVGIYFFIKKKHNLAGLLLGIAVMTRFFQIFLIIPIFLVLFYSFYRKKVSMQKSALFPLFFLLPIIPYLILNYLLYNNPLHPFLLQIFMTQNTGFVFNEPFSFYFINLFKENILILFALVGLFTILKKPSKNSMLLSLIFLFGFIPYNIIAHKEMRLLIPIFPFIAILMSHGIFYFADSVKKYKVILLSLLSIIFIIQAMPQLKFNAYEDNLDDFYDYIKKTGTNPRLWISNPAFIVFSDAKADELVYYPAYNSDKIDDLMLNVDNADTILLNTCDLLPCPPNDSDCDKKSSDFIDNLKQKFATSSYSKNRDCKYYIFTFD
ncbi:MAG: glycosyltransferase family 39 protein [Candidatus Woesearchaeota archaeon]|jgi:hypothetical protein|nr:glycosyltransferase family 39 protein [Candidatus Woesearchaeota archaeon]MDP7623050.1 glycosyltransferase family 39 protein [Candidatus Woesearchaeota archaeon]HJN56730.1 glycosyltransferase family 39 protein [Candidatus Woesearchaeota archaeon]|tara:strand:+ start:15246 stop:16628 length:1383 start_codon:yes stop_codon:yes gene_type:complete